MSGRLLSQVFAEAADKADEVTRLDVRREGKVRALRIEEIRTLMSEARDLGIYYRDDNVEALEVILGKAKPNYAEELELRKRFRILVRCAEWVEVSRFEKDP